MLAPESSPMPPVMRSAPLEATTRPLSAFSKPAWKPPYLASLERPGASTGTPRWWPISTQAAAMRAVSRAANE